MTTMQTLSPAETFAHTPRSGESIDGSDQRSRAVRAAAFDSTAAFLSGINRMEALWAAAIVLENNAGFLLPVCDVHANDDTVAAPPVAPGARFMRFLVATASGAVASQLLVTADAHDSDRMHIAMTRAPLSGAASALTSVALRALARWLDEHFQPDVVLAAVQHGDVSASDIFASRVHHGVAAANDIFASSVHHGDDAANDIFASTVHHDVPAANDIFASTVHHGVAAANDIFASAGFDMASGASATYAYTRRHVLPEQWPSLILTAGPLISARESVYAADAARNGWNGEWNKYLAMLEKEFAEYVGTKYAIATSSCTGALHLALLALDIGPGDEVIVPDCTWVATANAVLYAGATPVFADVDRDTWTLDPDSFESLITPRTKAVMPVHMYGHPSDMLRIRAIADAHDIAIVEDAAPSIGAECGGKRTGSFGEFSCFSFQGAKLMVTGEGGMLCTNSEELYRKAFKMWDQGRQPGGFWIDANGWKYKMSNIQAALGVGQLQHVDMMIEAKRRIAGWYREGLDGVEGISVWQEASWARSIYWMSSILVHDGMALDRDALRAELRRRNVDTRSVFPAISQYPIWPREQAPQPTALYVGNHGMNLPSGVRLTQDEVAYTCRAIRQAMGQ